ncbi:PIG-L family deacetylase [Endozoicomonas gorgoniicola]|uniref:PIG-L family deacetylase n=1 Tax=Endozoicomonas gorgoniicola TaxID=1234144 RepID=A0ABT3N059_9GAMM|nr:PIG-L family deacetylase [Endozoicomonas gorgoniicola]MCW7555003.1 PIG-L family deacetylase [Endozoicomonas gorgoniicola]
MQRKSIYISASIILIMTLAFGLKAIIPALVIIWLLHQIIFSDHIWYNTNEDYTYEFSDVNAKSITIEKGTFSFESSNQPTTYLIEVFSKSTLTGKFLDPYVKISCKDKQIQHYFERSVNGKRFLNITSLVESFGSYEITIEQNYCSISNSAVLYTFNNSNINLDCIMVIAPHADDAEIAAFGLYSNTNSHIVTVTAGEVEPYTFKHFSSNSKIASRLKGLVRSWDSLTVPVWGNQPFSNSIQLGYFCKQLPAMEKSPLIPVLSQTSEVTDTRVFRQFNAFKLSSDNSGHPTWVNLVQDFVELINQIKPTTIITPHEQLDSHPDHKAATSALREALSKSNHHPDHLLLYTNHLSTTDMHPFGPAHTSVSLPPSLEVTKIESVFSFPLNEEDQLAKAVSLEMMHDLRRPQKLKQKIRSVLQSIFIDRKTSNYGHDPFFRKSVRSNELFFIESINDDA